MRINRKQLDKVLLSTPDLNTTARMILLAYASHMPYSDDPQEAWPSDEAVCNYAGIALNTLYKHRDGLLEDGFLILTRQERQRGTNKVVRYYALGRGKLKSPCIMRRKPTDKQVTNIIANARRKKEKGELAESSAHSAEKGVLHNVQRRVLHTVERGSLHNVETNIHLEQEVEEQEASAGAAAYDDDSTSTAISTDSGSPLITEGSDSGEEPLNTKGKGALHTVQNSTVDYRAEAAKDPAVLREFEKRMKPRYDGSTMSERAAYILACNKVGKEVKK